MNVSVSESLRDAVFIAVAGVLAADDVVAVDRQHRAEDLVLLLADRPGLQRRRRFHHHERHHLQQVGDDHVLEGAGALVEVGPLVEAQRLRDVDLDVVDEVAVPDRLEQAVGETERQDVLRGLLAQEVVDAEDLSLAEGLVHEVVEFDRAGKVGAERLLHHHPGALDQLGVAQHRDDGTGGLRRDRKVVQPQRFRSELGLGLLHRGGQRLGPALCGT